MFQEIHDANIEIHAHPFNGNNTIADVIEAMNLAGLDVIALSAPDKNISPYVSQKVAEHYKDKKIVIDDSGARLPNGKYVLNACEHGTKEGLHVLTVGNVPDVDPKTEIRKVIDLGLKQEALVVIAHPFIDGKSIIRRFRLSPSGERMLEDLCKEYSWQIALEWNGYFITWLQLCVGDVNKKAEKLSDRLAKQGYFVPELAATDLHARKKELLSAIGTARFMTNVNGECADDIVRSMKDNIFAGNYKNRKRYVSTSHFLEAMVPATLRFHYFNNPIRDLRDFIKRIPT